MAHLNFRRCQVLETIEPQTHTHTHSCHYSSIKVLNKGIYLQKKKCARLCPTFKEHVQTASRHGAWPQTRQKTEAMPGGDVQNKNLMRFSASSRHPPRNSSTLDTSPLHPPPLHPPSLHAPPSTPPAPSSPLHVILIYKQLSDAILFYASCPTSPSEDFRAKSKTPPILSNTL